MNGVRQSNHRSTTTWLKRVLSDTSPVDERDELTATELAHERIVFGLRMLAVVAGKSGKSKERVIPLHRFSAHVVVSTVLVFELIKVCPENSFDRFNAWFLHRDVVSAPKKWNIRSKNCAMLWVEKHARGTLRYLLVCLNITFSPSEAHFRHLET